MLWLWYILCNYTILTLKKKLNFWQFVVIYFWKLVCQYVSTLDEYIDYFMIKPAIENILFVDAGIWNIFYMFLYI